MGKLIEGRWSNEWYDTKSKGGAFERESSVFEHWIDAAPQSTFPAESGRYHLYVSLACPWAHRTLIFRKLKALEPHIAVSVVSPDMLEHGWSFDTKTGSTGDALYGLKYLHELYTQSEPKYSGRVTVPVLWDKKTEQIVNNESSQIIRIFNRSFNQISGNKANYYPEALQEKIDAINAFVYEKINNGVYRCGFATSQEAYEEAYALLFAALDEIEKILSKNRYLLGNTLTEADWRLFTTLIRFDEVYYSHFKCNKKRLEDFPNLSAYRRELYQYPGVAETTDFLQIKRHYYVSQTTINPTQIVPLGPEIDYKGSFSSRVGLSS